MLYMSIERKMQQIYNPTFWYVHESSYKNASNTSFSRAAFFILEERHYMAWLID
jgi:hypothetical protein